MRIPAPLACPLHLLLPALMLAVVLISTPPTTAGAQPDGWLPTVVTADGSLWELPLERQPRLIRSDLGHGLAVSDLAWNPVKPELLLIRREMRGSEPYDSLYRIDLRSGAEELLEGDVGPQARLLQPQWSPDGTWGIARLECCLSREVVRFSFPTRAGSPNRIFSNAFLPNDAREVAMADAGGFNAAGEILMSVVCCMGDEVAPDPRGIYAMPRNFQQTRLLVPGDHGTPIGAAADGSWIATLRPGGASNGRHLGIVRPDGATTTLTLPTDAAISDRGMVLPDGSLIVGTWPAGARSLTSTYSAIWTLQADGSAARKLTEGSDLPFVAFSMAPAILLAELSASGPPPGPPTRVYFARDPESFNDFSAVFPVERGPLTPTSAIQALIAGPTPEEIAQGFSAELRTMLPPATSNCGADVELMQIGETLVLRFCRVVTSAGIGQDARFLSQINATLRQFPGITTVRVLDDRGQCLFDMSGENRCLPGPAR